MPAVEPRLARRRPRSPKAIPGPASETAVKPDVFNATNTPAASVIDEAVLDGLGRLQGKSRPDLIPRVITIFLKTARDRLRGFALGKPRRFFHPCRSTHLSEGKA